MQYLRQKTCLVQLIETGKTFQLPLLLRYVSARIAPQNTVVPNCCHCALQCQNQ